MSTSSKLKRVSKPNKYLISGYIRQIQQCIPVDIQNVILLFFHPHDGFNVDYHGKGLIFSNNDMTVKLQETHSCATCILGHEISKTNCDKLDVTLEWIKGTCFAMGFITTQINKSIKDWNKCLGVDANRQHSVGLIVNKHNTKLVVCTQNNNGVTLDRVTGHRYKSNHWNSPCCNNEDMNENDHNFLPGDMFTLSFNILNGVLTVYHNGFYLNYISLQNFEGLTPAFTLFGRAEIEIRKYELEFEEF
eukprot:17881_1